MSRTVFVPPQPLFARKTQDQTVTSSTDLVDAAGLTVTVSPGRTYLLDLVCFYDSGSTPDLKVGLVAPSGATGTWGGAPARNTADSAPNLVHAPIGSTISSGGAGAGALVTARFAGLVHVGATGGTFKVQFAQDVSSGTATILKADSYLRLTPAT